MLLSAFTIVVATVLANLCEGQLSICQYARVTVSNPTVALNSSSQSWETVPANASFRSPLPSENITSSQECLLQVSGSGIIQIDVTAFDLGGRDPCSADEEYLSIDFYKSIYGTRQVRSNRGYSDSVRWCGRSYSTRLETRQLMVLRYSGGQPSQRGTGFSIRISRVDQYTCGGGQVKRIGDQPMYIYSPGYPAPYDNYINMCDWDLTSANQGHLLLESLRFFLEPHANCGYDFLSIDGDKYCGDQRVRVRSQYDDFHISLFTDHADRRDGFILKVVEMTPDVTSCGQHVMAGSAPMALQVPKLSERHFFSVNCWWVVDAGSNDSVVLLEKTRFQTTASCTEFELRIYDGPNDTQSKRILSSCAPVEMFQTVRSSSRYLYIDINIHVTGISATTIDVVYTVTSQHKNAVPRILYAGLADSFIWLNLGLTNDMGLLVRGSEEDIENYSSCLQLSLKHFPTQTSALNIRDYFYVFSGWNSSFAELGSACGRSSSELLISRGSKVYIVFRENLPTSTHGVWLTYRLRKYAEYCEPQMVRLQSSSHVIQTLSSDLAYTPVTQTILRLSSVYPNNAFCRWLIQAENSTSFTQAVVTQSRLMGPDCYDNVTAYDYPEGARGQSALLQWCREDRPVVMSSKGSGLLLQFVSNPGFTSAGFNISYISVFLVNECPSMVVVKAEESPQYLTSPNYPHNYPNGVDCRWRMQAKAGVVKLTLLNLSIAQETTSCSLADYLVIYDGWDRSGRVLADLCGSHSNELQLTSTGASMMVHFHSNHVNTAAGFRFQYQSTEDSAVIHCNRRVFVTDNEDSDVTTPYFPSAYPGNTDCYWLVEAPLTHVVMLEVIDLDLPCDSPVVLYDGPSESSLKIVSLCGKRYQRNYVSTQKSLYIRFRSTSNVGYIGFKFRLRSWKSDGACVGQVAHLMAYTTKRYISSPGYPGAYPPNSDCRWRIESAYKNMSVRVDIMNADVQSSPDCDMDRLSVYDGYGPGSNLLGKYCNDHSESFWSTEIYLYLHFVSDSSISYKGFQLSYQAVQEQAPGTPLPGSGEGDMGTGAIIGGVMGGVAFLIIGITLFLCYLGRCQRPQPSPSSASHSSPRGQRDGSTVFVMNPVIVNHMAPPPPYPGLTNSSYVPDDLPPAYPASPAASVLPPPFHLDAPPSYSEAIQEAGSPPAGTATEEEGHSSLPPQQGEGRGYESRGPPSESGQVDDGDPDSEDYQRVSSATSRMPLAFRSSGEGEGEYHMASSAFSGASTSPESAHPRAAHHQPSQTSSSTGQRPSRPPPAPQPQNAGSAEQRPAPPRPATWHQSRSSSSQLGRPRPSAPPGERRSQALAEPPGRAPRPERTPRNSSSPGQAASPPQPAPNYSTPRGPPPPPPAEAPQSWIPPPSYEPPSRTQRRPEASPPAEQSEPRQPQVRPAPEASEQPQNEASARQGPPSRMSGAASEADHDSSNHGSTLRLDSVDSVGTAV